MDKTFINIGNVIKKTNESRILYHPLIGFRNIVKKDKKGNIELNPEITIHELHVNIDDNIVEYVERDIQQYDNRIIRFAISSADSKVSYLAGSCVIKKGDILNQLSLNNFNEKYVKKYPKVLIKDSIIVKFRNVLETGKNIISELVSQYINNKEIVEIALIMEVTYNGERKPIYEFIECLDEMDSMFLQSSYVKNKGYIFTSAFYSMFNYGKFETDNISTMYEDSIPYLNKEDFLSLYYARTIYNKISLFLNKDYSVSIYPNYENLTMEDIENLIFEGTDIFDFNKICDRIKIFIDNSVKRVGNRKDLLFIPQLLKFDVYYKYKLGKAGNQNMLRLSGVRYAQLLRIKKHVDNEYYPTYYNKETNSEVKKSMYYLLTDLYQDYNGKSDRYMSIIIHTLQNIYQENYIVPQEAEFCLLNNCEHLARIGKMDDFRKSWNNLFKIFKFLKTMEDIKFVSELTNKPSYKLGVELAKFEAGWKDGRKNLEKTIQQFTGNISRIVYSIDNVLDYYQNLVERMARNKIFYGEHNELLLLLHSINNKEFNKKEFIMGYYTEKNTYKKDNLTNENK